jgi:hypothetical protein
MQSPLLDRKGATLTHSHAPGKGYRQVHQLRNNMLFNFHDSPHVATVVVARLPPVAILDESQYSLLHVTT